MRRINKILIVQTAFLGDVILTLPLVHVTRQFFAPATIDLLTIPRTAEVLRNHPDISSMIEFDKRGRDGGMKGLMRMARLVREGGYDIALVPHRSIRSALIVWLARIPIRVGFSKSTGRFLFTKRIKYEPDFHEIDRNISLLDAFGIRWEKKEYPNLFPSDADIKRVDELLSGKDSNFGSPMIAIAPGTVWNTKRWPIERFADLSRRFQADGFRIALIGGREDESLCADLANALPEKMVVNAAGQLTILQSAELIRRSRLLICNDSAPLHLAVAMRTPIVAIFGATIPEFGFAPFGKHDVVVETRGLNCRPCSKHGGDKCPIKTFVCMKDITADKVFAVARGVLEKTVSQS